MNSCSHPHVLVTGASSGIGRAAALRLAVNGYHVFAGVRRPADGTALGQGAGREITPVLLGGQPAPGSRADAPQPARAAEPAMR